MGTWVTIWLSVTRPKCHDLSRHIAPNVIVFVFIFVFGKNQSEKDPLSTMQKTEPTKYSSFLAWKRVSPMDVVTRGRSTSIVLCIWPFLARWQTNQPTKGWSKCKPALDQWAGSLLQYKVMLIVELSSSNHFLELLTRLTSWNHYV